MVSIPNLIVRPFSRKGVFTSLRQFTINALNIHHGMEVVEGSPSGEQLLRQKQLHHQEAGPGRVPGPAASDKWKRPAR